MSRCWSAVPSLRTAETRTRSTMENRRRSSASSATTRSTTGMRSPILSTTGPRQQGYVACDAVADYRRVCAVPRRVPESKELSDRSAQGGSQPPVVRREVQVARPAISYEKRRLINEWMAELDRDSRRDLLRRHSAIVGLPR